MLIDKPRCNFKNCRYCFDGNCFSADKYENCKLTDLHCEIAKLTVDLDNAKTEWISVEEMLPEDSNVRVLVYINSERSYTKIDTDRYNQLDGSWVRWYKNVTHWMPLPEPPKMKGGAE